MNDIPLPTPKTVECLISELQAAQQRVKELEETNLNNVANYQLQVKDLEQQHKAWKVLESDIVFEQLQKKNAELTATISRLTGGGK